MKKNSHQVSIKKITGQETLVLRQSILRPHQKPEECVYPFDEEPATLHVGALAGDHLIGIASIYHECQDGIWRIRGMAVHPSWQGHHVGQTLLKRCLEHAKEQGGHQAWCNARTHATGFYHRAGFEVEGGEFSIPGIGPHFRMVFNLTK